MNKILWHSNGPLSPVGYGIQTGLFTPRIRDLGYDVAISAFYGSAATTVFYEDMPVFPADENYGNRLIAAYASIHGDGDPRGCLVITLMDVWVLNNAFLNQLRLASWVPVDHDPAPPNVLNYFKTTGATPIAMSRFGETKLREAGLDPLYVPHGVDTSIFHPLDTGPILREKYDIPQDAFLVGMVANNKGFMPCRKSFPEVFEAFAKFHAKHSDAFLYVHSERMGVRQGVSLVHLAEFFGIEDCIRFAPQTEMELGIPQSSMAEVYSMFDVLANPSYGEGFGIPIIEAQACGVPVIVTNFTSMPELCGSGFKVEGERLYDTGQAAFFMRPNVGHLARTFDKAYDRAASMRDAAVEFAQGYDADLIATTMWKPVLETLMEESDGMEALA